MTPKVSAAYLYFLYLINVFFFGSSWMFNKMVLNEGAGPVWAATLRQSIAALAFLLVFLFRRPGVRPSRRDILLISIYGISMLALAHVFSFMGQQYLNSGLASIIFSIFPIMVLLISGILMPRREPLTLMKFLGSIIGFSGIIFIFYSKNTSDTASVSLSGILLVLLAVFVNAVPNVLIKRDGGNIDPLLLNTGGMLVAVLFLIPFAFIAEGVPHFALSPKLLLAELYLGIFCSAVAFFIYFYLLRKISVFKMSLSAYLTPLVAILLGYVFFDEKLFINHYIGMLLIMAGIFISGIKHAGKAKAGTL
ncbi:MAG: DMT family transporter [Candidatus Marinimicrobia bacterium]|jgi:drug/metabolite transporter (DMT)-like permease|nr:DMT family transporter [Candidatus Neomarinimicrobiota bacterium]MDD5709122.1 DMT family transporter [Candidatus Neomarinimicrobiota bacterium]MDX9778285.1 DMT family transporter [bacterium]